MHALLQLAGCAVAAIYLVSLLITVRGWRQAPFGYEDDDGFHEGGTPQL